MGRKSPKGRVAQEEQDPIGQQAGAVKVVCSSTQAQSCDGQHRNTVFFTWIEIYLEVGGSLSLPHAKEDSKSSARPCLMPYRPHRTHIEDSGDTTHPLRRFMVVDGDGYNLGEKW